MMSTEETGGNLLSHRDSMLNLLPAPLAAAN